MKLYKFLFFVSFFYKENIFIWQKIVTILNFFPFFFFVKIAENIWLWYGSHNLSVTSLGLKCTDFCPKEVISTLIL